MPLAESFREHAEYLADLTYEPHGVGYRFKVVPTNPPLTERRGVYFLLSHSHTKVQKVGLANGVLRYFPWLGYEGRLSLPPTK